MLTDLNKQYQLACPTCYSDLVQEENLFRCLSCKAIYPVVDNIPDFRESDEYWCNVSREKMQLLNKLARERNDWVSAAKEVVPEYMGHFYGFQRADTQFIWPDNPGMRILDAGSMWGGLTIPVAQYAKEVYAIDKTPETLSFLDIRADQMGFKNIYPIASTLEKLPFKDGYFDLVILNGVLEWVAHRQDLILEKHWDKKAGVVKKYAQDPLTMQIDVLRELGRVTKPNGYLFLAIENRVGYQYLTGAPDDHVNIKFVSFLPRKIADIITRMKRGFSYRTYIYSSAGYKNILSKAGYKRFKFYGAFVHYISPYAVIPFDLMKRFKKLILLGGGKRLKLFFSMLPAFLMKYFSPSIIVVAAKSEREFSDERIIRIIKKSGFLPDNLSAIEPILISRRFNTYTPLHCLIYDVCAKKPTLFCKISRSKDDTQALDDEAENLSYTNALMRNTLIGERIPQLLYSGTIEGARLLVTNYLDCRPYCFKTIRKLDKAIRESLDFLVDFQKHSAGKEVEVSEYFPSRIMQQKSLLCNQLDDCMNRKIDELAKSLAGLTGVKLRLSAVHGDFDFYHNVLLCDKKTHVVDFEHFQKEGTPFLDLAMLLLHPFIIDFKKKNRKEGFEAFLREKEAPRFLEEWLKIYFEKSRIDDRLRKYVLKIALLEQNTKDYPYYRDKKTFPLNDFGILELIFANGFGRGCK